MPNPFPPHLAFVEDWFRSRALDDADDRALVDAFAELLDAHRLHFVEVSVNPRAEFESLIQIALRVREDLGENRERLAQRARGCSLALAWHLEQQRLGRSMKSAELASRWGIQRSAADRIRKKYDFLGDPISTEGPELSGEQRRRTRSALDRLKSEGIGGLSNPRIDPPLSPVQHLREGREALSRRDFEDAVAHLAWAQVPNQEHRPTMEAYYLFGLACLEAVDGLPVPRLQEELLNEVKALFTRGDLPDIDRRDRDVDWIALEGRLFRTMASRCEPGSVDRELALRCAYQAYRRALDQNPLDHYAAGQAAAAWARVHAARPTAETKRRLANIVERALAPAQRASALGEGYWADFTLAELHVLRAEIDLAEICYRRGLEREPPPSPRDQQSVLRGMRRSAEAVGIQKEASSSLEALLSQDL